VGTAWDARSVDVHGEKILDDDRLIPFPRNENTVVRLKRVVKCLITFRPRRIWD
jgi:hypothetical protein